MCRDLDRHFGLVVSGAVDTHMTIGKSRVNDITVLYCVEIERECEIEMVSVLVVVGG